MRTRLGDAVAQHGLEHLRRRGRGGLRARALGGSAAEFAGLDDEETAHAVDAGLRVLRGAGLAPRGFVAPAYYYSRALRREVERRFAWYAGLWRMHGTRPSAPALCLGTSTALKRATSPALVRAGARLGGRLLRLDVHPADFDRPRHVAALERVLERAAEPRARDLRRAGARAYCFFQPPPKRRDSRPPSRGRKVGGPFSGGGSDSASAEVIVRVTPALGRSSHLGRVDEAAVARRSLDDQPVEDVLAVVVGHLDHAPDLDLVGPVDRRPFSRAE